MNKKLKYLFKSIKEYFDIDEINKTSKDPKFIQRKGNITTKGLGALLGWKPRYV